MAENRINKFNPLDKFFWFDVPLEKLAHSPTQDAQNTL
jgi:hypothetical protein